MRHWGWLLLVVWVALAPGCKKTSGGSTGPDRATTQTLRLGAPDTRTWRRSTLDAHALRIEVGEKDTLPIERLRVSAQVDGFRARVVLYVDFENTHDRVLEGAFQLRLPEGASPFHLAFGGQAEHVPPTSTPAHTLTTTQILEALGEPEVPVREAQMVERDLAAVAFDTTVQRGIDPALAEWTGTGIFDARLFPLMPRAVHRVVVGYDVDLTEVGGAWQLPIGVPAGAKERLLDLTVATPAGIDATLAGTLPVAEEGGRTRWRIEDPERELFELTVRGADAFVLRGDDPSTGPYYAARLRPELPIASSDGARRAVFAVDVSLSSDPDRFEVWLALMQGILAANRDEIRELAVVFFNVETFWWQPRFVPNTATGVADLRAFVETLALEGATDLGAAIDEAVQPSWLSETQDWDVFLLSDGASTWGESSLERILERTAKLQGRLFAYRTGLTGGDTAALDRLARETGGAVFSVGGAAEVTAAATAHRAQPWELLAVEIDGVQDVVVEGGPRFIYPGQSLALGGRATTDREPTKATFRVRRGGESKPIDVALPRAIASELAPRVYGQIAVAQLEEVRDATAARTLSFARHFRVPGPSASLLMLEDADYGRFGITRALAESDAKVVADQLATSELATARARLALEGTDPKRRFDAWRGRLPATQQIVLPPHVAEFVDALPREAFVLETPQLQCKRHDRAAMGADLLHALRTGELDYDAVLDDATRRRHELGASDGLKALSSLVELRSGDGPLARDVALVAEDWGLAVHVTDLLRRTAVTQPDEPETYHALAWNLARVGAYDLAAAYFEIALHAQSDVRMIDYRRVAVLDYLAMLRHATLHDPQFAARRRAELQDELGIEPSDLVIAVAWTTDNTDVDLHVVEPDGTEVFYGNPRPRRRGALVGSPDVRGGYGPEIYAIRRGAPGAYRVFVHHYRSDPNRLSARTRVRATVFHNYRREGETIEQTSVALRDGAEMHEVGIVKLGTDAVRPRPLRVAKGTGSTRG